MCYSDILKYIGIITAGACAIVGLLGDHRRTGKLSRIGKCLIALSILGMAIAIIFDRISIKEARTKERIRYEWARIMQEPVTTLDFSCFLIGEVEISELEKLIETEEVAFALIEPEGVVSGFRRVGMKVEHSKARSGSDPGLGPLLTVVLCDSNLMLAKHPATLYKIRARQGWVEAYCSTEQEWKKETDSTCGISSLIPWTKLGFSDIRHVKDLSKLTVRYKCQEKFELIVERFYEKEPHVVLRVRISSPSFSFQLDPSLIGFRTLIDETVSPKVRYVEASISGHQLLTFCRSQFTKSGGIRSHQREKDGLPLHVISGKPKYVELSTTLVKL